jgi:cell wall-associated NlpC family hydrolase
MAGKHRKPSPFRPKVPRFAVGAVAASVALTAASSTVMPMATMEPIPLPAAPAPAPLLLEMPPWTTSLAALYLPHLATSNTTVGATGDVHPATPVTLAADTHPADAPHQAKHPAPVTVKAAGVTGGLAARVITAAMGQQGVPYVYGGNTPGGALDCSSLVQYAYRTAGISLPRTADAQASMGRTVSLADIQPGDLLYFYSPITHVAMALGGGKIIEASQPGHPIAVRSLYTNGLATIKRLIG